MAAVRSSAWPRSNSPSNGGAHHLDNESKPKPLMLKAVRERGNLDRIHAFCQADVSGSR